MHNGITIQNVLWGESATRTTVSPQVTMACAYVAFMCSDTVFTARLAQQATGFGHCLAATVCTSLLIVMAECSSHQQAFNGRQQKLIEI